MGGIFDLFANQYRKIQSKNIDLGWDAWLADNSFEVKNVSHFLHLSFGF